MNKTQEVLNEYRSLKKSYSGLVDVFNTLTQMQVKYNQTTGNLSIENVNMIIE